VLKRAYSVVALKCARAARDLHLTCRKSLYIRPVVAAQLFPQTWV